MSCKPDTAPTPELNLASLSDHARSPAFRDETVALLLDLCRIDTTTRPDVSVMAQREAACFKLIQQALTDAAAILNGQFVRQAINPKIADHPFYSKPAYTIAPPSNTLLSAEQTYGNRANLLFLADAEQQLPGVELPGAGVAVNAHVDVVHPYIPPRVEGSTVYGRGSCDDKGPLVSIIGSLRLVAEYLRKNKLKLVRPLTAMFVIEEEMGGNGSLAAAMDRQLRKRYDTIAVLECCDSHIYPGNRGAVWYKVEGDVPGDRSLEAAAFIVEQMEREGRAIKSESRHDLFPHRPVQTCHGILGSFGQHPSRICGRIAFDIVMDHGSRDETLTVRLRDVLESGLAEYINLYGDKTKVADPTTGKPKVDHHYDLETTDHGWRVSVHGSTGHMGAILSNDGAITKAASMIRALVYSRIPLEQMAGSAITLRLDDKTDANHLLMEGGQGFLPTHVMADVQQRLAAAVNRGFNTYLHLIGATADNPRVTFEKLHNAAFAGPRNSPAMLDALAAAGEAGVPAPALSQVKGWDVSCDSRIFACEYSDLTVLTMGPGLLRHAHADDEQISVDELMRFTELMARFILKQCGTVRAG
ncbi:MAG: M20/M25/M40 family metallo-hydrolase [Phycisphaerales bacterium]